ncbi:MAG TPA: DUF1569 domain-containing protein [Candidatus Saccharimonadales bacterium]|nr:DUF1569 domain-containing protein [Candidatus Saccharimonadales bacterium]
MDAWLDRLCREIKETTKLCEVDWVRAPQGCWNSSQILEHLGRTYGTTAKMLELAMGVGGPAQVRPATVSERLAKLVVINLGFLPRGAKSPSVVLPKGDRGPVALERALNNLDRMKTAIALAEERWGSEEPIAMHPALGPLTATQWRKFHYMHGHHHLRQVRSRSGTSAGRGLVNP